MAESTTGTGSKVGSSVRAAVGAGLVGLTVSPASGAAGVDSASGADPDPARSDVLAATAFAELVSPVFATSEEGACSSNSVRLESDEASEEDVSTRTALPEAVNRTPGGIRRSAPSELPSSSLS